MDRRTKRNIAGSVACLLSAVVVGAPAIAYWMWREVRQAEKYGFAVETDDIKRYSVIGAIGAIGNCALWVWMV